MQNSKIMLIAGAALSATTFSAIAETPAYQNELRADAASRASLLQTGANAGHNSNGFYVGSGDGNFNLYVGGYTQFTYTLSFRDGDDSSLMGESEDFTNGFDAKRTRLIFQGNVLNPNLSFYIEGGFDYMGESNNGNFNLLEAWGNYNFDNGWGIKWGQYRVPLTRENMVDARHQLAGDRSVVDSVFNADRTQGVAVHYRGDNLGFVASINDGAGNRSTPFWTGATNAGGLAVESDIALTARLEYMFAGDWGRFEDFTSFRNSDDIAVLLGGAIHWQQGGETAGFAGGTEVALTDYDLLTYTIDLSVEGNGWNVFGSFVGRSVDADGSSDVDDFGWLIQGGFFVADQFEIFGRYDSVIVDDAYAADETFNTITLGANYYFVPESHAAKFTFDVAWFLDDPSENSPVAATAPNSRTSLVPDAEDNQFALRAQMQLVF